MKRMCLIAAVLACGGCAGMGKHSAGHHRHKPIAPGPQPISKVRVGNLPPRLISLAPDGKGVVNALYEAGVFQLDGDEIACVLPPGFDVGSTVVRVTREVSGEVVRMTFPVALGLNGSLAMFPLKDGDDIAVVRLADAEFPRPGVTPSPIDAATGAAGVLPTGTFTFERPGLPSTSHPIAGFLQSRGFAALQGNRQKFGNLADRTADEIMVVERAMTGTSRELIFLPITQAYLVARTSLRYDPKNVSQSLYNSSEFLRLAILDKDIVTVCFLEEVQELVAAHAGPLADTLMNARERAKPNPITNSFKQLFPHALRIEDRHDRAIRE